MSDVLDFYSKYPYMAGPAALAQHDLGVEKAGLTAHINLLAKEFVTLIYEDNDRLIVNAPFRSGKTQTLTIYGSAWYLMHNPTKKVKVMGATTDLTEEWGFATREIIRRYGVLLGLKLRKDTAAKAHWRIDGYGGEYMALSKQSQSTIGMGYDLGICDDAIGKDDQAASDIEMESVWRWFTTTMLSRRDPGAKILINNVRWNKRDITGRIKAAEKMGAPKWRQVVLRALATEDDVLGRKIGEGLWPKSSSMFEQSKINMKDAEWHSHFYLPNYQQEVHDEEGKFFQPTDKDGNIIWPLYVDLGDAYSLAAKQRKIWLYRDMTIFVTVDWAASDKNSSDFMAIGVFGMTPEGDMLVLEIIEKHVSIENAVPLLDTVCQEWRPHLVAVEANAFQAALANECRRYPAIPEPRLLNPGNKANAKLVRALDAIVMGEKHRIYLPDDRPAWLSGFIGRLVDFEGARDDIDDVIDVLSYACMQARDLKPASRIEQPPCIFEPAPERLWSY